MNAIDLMPTLLDAFHAAINDYRGQPDTPENRRAAAGIITHYTSRVQLLDLTLSESAARALLATTYKKG